MRSSDSETCQISGIFLNILVACCDLYWFHSSLNCSSLLAKVRAPLVLGMGGGRLQFPQFPKLSGEVSVFIYFPSFTHSLHFWKEWLHLLFGRFFGLESVTHLNSKCKTYLISLLKDSFWFLRIQVVYRILSKSSFFILRIFRFFFFLILFALVISNCYHYFVRCTLFIFLFILVFTSPSLINFVSSFLFILKHLNVIYLILSSPYSLFQDIFTNFQIPKCLIMNIYCVFPLIKSIIDVFLLNPFNSLSLLLLFHSVL